MGTVRFVSYLRVSTDRQGRSGLGLDAQRQAVTDYLNGGSWELVQEVIEVESGGKNDRPQLQGAIEKCRAYGAKLVVAKIDRLTRDAAFLLNLRDAGIDFVAADMPDANRLTVGIMALVAEQEREAISARTKAALAAAKLRGVQLGAYRDVVWRAEYQLGKIMGLLGNKPVNHRPPQDAVFPKFIGRGVFTVDDVLTEMDKLLTQVGIFHHEDFRKVTSTGGGTRGIPIVLTKSPSGWAQVTHSHARA